MRLEYPVFVEMGSGKVLALPLKLTFLVMKLIGVIYQWTTRAVL